MSNGDTITSNKFMTENVIHDDPSESHHEKIDLEGREDVPHFHAKTWLVVFAVSLIYAAHVINLVGLGTHGRDIVAVIGGAQKSSWLIGAVVIMVVVFGPPFSQAADFWGRRWFLIVPTFCGGIGSIIMSRATSMDMALAGQCIVGISYGAQPLLHAVASEVLTHRNRVAAQAAVNAGSGLGGVAGLLIGAALMGNGNPGGFRSYWYMTAGIYLVATVVTAVFYTPPLRKLQTELSFKEKINRLDWIGYALLGSGLLLFMMALFWAQNPYSWRNPHVLAPLLIGATISAVFVVYEWKFKADGLVHHGLFSRDRNFAIALGGIFCEGLVYFAANAFMPFQAEVLYETSKIRISLQFCIAFIVFITSVWVVALYCYRYRRLRFPVIFAFVCFLAFNICMATTTVGSRSAIWAYPVFLGLGMAFALCGLVTAAQLSAPPELIASTSGLMVSARSLGGAVGLAIYSAVFNAKLNSTLANKVADAVLPLGLPASSLPSVLEALSTHSAKALSQVPGINGEIIQAAVQAFSQSFVDSFRGVWITAACFTSAALAASCFLIDPIEAFNLHVDAPAEREEAIFGRGLRTDQS